MTARGGEGGVRHPLWESAVSGPCIARLQGPLGWPGSRVVSVLDSGAEGPGFKSQSRRCLRQTVHTHCASVHQAAKLIAALLRVVGVTVGLAESNVTCRLAAKNRDQLRNPTLGNRVWATFIFLC